MTIAPTGLAPRRCHLRDADHKYVWEPTGEEMAISVTGVCSFFKEPYDGPPEAAWRGTHVHRAMESICTGKPFPSENSPEGINCSDWFTQLQGMKFWDQIEVIACEFTMVNTLKSLGGQLDLLCRFKGKTLLVDLKTKSKWWSPPQRTKKDGSPNPEGIAELLSYSQQAGGYLELLATGNDAHSPPWVDECRTLIVTPNQVKWLSAMQPDDCSEDWQTAWGSYANAIKSTF